MRRICGRVRSDVHEGTEENAVTIDQLGLGPYAKAAALDLLTTFGPDVIRFTRGYSDLRGQARAMAANVVRNKDWIAQTYTRTDRPSYTVACRLHDAVYLHADLQNRMQVEQVLYDALLAIPNGHEISFHTRTLNGQPAAEAFDLHPLVEVSGVTTAEGQRVLDYIQQRKEAWHVDAFLTHEGGLRIWHLQFRCGARAVEV